MANLLLSQQRALAVMQFLYESNIVDKKLLSTFVNSSGRSSVLILILDKKVLEDKDASRSPSKSNSNTPNEEAYIKRYKTIWINKMKIEFSDKKPLYTPTHLEELSKRDKAKIVEKSLNIFHRYL